MVFESLASIHELTPTDSDNDGGPRHEDDDQAQCVDESSDAMASSIQTAGVVIFNDLYQFDQQHSQLNLPEDSKDPYQAIPTS